MSLSMCLTLELGMSLALALIMEMSINLSHRRHEPFLATIILSPSTWSASSSLPLYLSLFSQSCPSSSSCVSS